MSLDLEIIINGVKTNYVVTGEGTPFLILHGWGSNSGKWQEIAEIISKKGFTPLENSGNGVAGRTSGSLTGFKVIVPDLPGCGKSDPLLIPWNTNKYINWIEQFVKELSLGDFYLLGHSFGGALASKLAVKHAQEVKKLFLVSAACVRKKTTRKSFFEKISKIIKIFYFLPYYGFLRKAVYKFIIRKSDYVYVEGIMKETYLNVIAEDLSFHLPFIKVPTVIIWGDKDEFTPLEDGYFINRQIKNSKLVVIPGAGHDLNRKQEGPEGTPGTPILAEKVLENI